MLPVADWTVAGEHGAAADIAHGRQLMAEGACACVLVAGGQGTRLGFRGPKGMFPVTVIKGKSLFQRLCERVLAASKQVGKSLPMAIMTSQDNDFETRAYFSQHDHFGLEPGQIEFFVQGSLPMLNDIGQLIEDNDGNVVKAADGNGSVFAHLVRSGIAHRWKEAGIRLISFIQVDNALADPFDAELLGFHARAQTDVTIKATWREDPLEKVGVIVREAGKTQVVEYTEIEMAERERRNADGTLVHRLANLSLFCFSLDFMQRVAALNMPLHVAKKMLKTEQGDISASKFEYFVFDALTFSRHTAILVSPRRRCFAALKNAAGFDSLETVRVDLLAYDRRIYEEITGRQPDLTAPLELSATYYYPPADFKKSLSMRDLPSAGYVD